MEPNSCLALLSLWRLHLLSCEWFWNLRPLPLSVPNLVGLWNYKRSCKGKLFLLRIGCSSVMLPVYSWDSLYFSCGFWLQDSVVVFGCKIPVIITLLCLNHNRLNQTCEHFAFMHVPASLEETQYSSSQCIRVVMWTQWVQKPKCCHGLVYSQ